MVKNFSFLLTCLMALALSANGQTNYRRINAGGIDMVVSTADTGRNDEFYLLGILPEFPGGTDSLVAFAIQHLFYPASAINDSIAGKITVAFFVDERGKVVKPEVVKGVRSDLNNACLTMLEQMPDWKPGMLNEGPVEVRFMWSIVFVLTD